ncbi:MAG: helix-turn-helix domain-containing protein [Muribaculaceae bacterium]|nr:helix-turn-helix domain-containing protein [Muribaculaceae bacterium]
MRNLLGIIIWLTAVACQAAAYHVAATLTGDNGLPHYQVNTLALDSKGYLWAGTRNGLSRYDGYSVRNYYHSDSDNTSLRHNYVRKVFIDSKNRMWVLTIHGLSRYIPESDRFINYPSLGSDLTAITETPEGNIICAGASLYLFLPETDSFKKIEFPSDFILSLAADSQGYVYLSTNQAIYRLDPSLKTGRPMPRHLYEGITTGAGDVIPLMTDSADNLWIGLNGRGIARYSLRSGKTDIIPGDSLPNPLVRVIAATPDGNILAGTGRGVAVISNNSHAPCVTPLTDLGDDSVYALMSGNDGNIWVGTYFGGITLLSPHKSRFGYLSPENSPMKGNVVRMMAETEPGTLWIATENGGISILDIRSGTITPFTDIPELGSNVHSLCHDPRNGCIWIGTFLKGLFRYDLSSRQWQRYLLSNGLDSNSIFYLAFDSQGVLNVATPRGMRRYDPETDTFRCIGHPRLDWTFVYTFLPDADGNLWVGTTTEGLFRIDGKTGHIDSWNPDSGTNRLTDKFVTTLCFDHTGNLWVGTNNGGLQTISPDGEVTPVPDDHRTICATACDMSGNIWVTTSTGIFRYSPDGTETARYTTANGLPTNQMNLSSVYRASDGRIYAGSVNGLISFYPEENRSTAGCPEVRIKTIWANGKELHPADSTGVLQYVPDNLKEITVPQSLARSLTLEYGVVMPGTPHDLSYQVMLEGSDTYWRNVGRERQVSLFNLSPGHYTLHIRASSSAGNWEEMPVKSIAITVRPPFYRSTLAIILYILLASVPVIIAVRRKRSEQPAGSIGSGSDSAPAISVQDSPEPSGNHVEREFIAAVDKLIAANLSNTDFCVDTITSTLGMSRTLLHNRIKSITGRSISDYIREKRFAEAVRLLSDGYNVSETAWRCGFADPGHFSKMFKKRFGILPSRYIGKE